MFHSSSMAGKGTKSTHIDQLNSLTGSTSSVYSAFTEENDPCGVRSHPIWIEELICHVFSKTKCWSLTDSCWQLKNK